MTKKTETASAPAAPVAAIVGLTAEGARGAANAIAKAAASNVAALAKADRDLLGNTCKAALAVGSAITEAQWDRWLAGTVRKAVVARVSAKTVSGTLSRAKATTLAYLASVEAEAATETALSGAKRNFETHPLHFGCVLPGETSNAYVERVRPFLANAKLANGDWIMAHNADGSAKLKGGAKPKAKAAEGTEGGEKVSPELAAARVLLKTKGKAADNLVTAIAEHRAEFDKWLALVTFNAAEAAKVAATSKAVFAAKDNMQHA
jgi:hypothetical protein